MYYARIEPVKGLFSVRIFSVFSVGITIFIAMSMISVINKYIKQSKEIENARRIESLGVFAGGIAHDFNNLLTAIMGNVSVIKYELEERSEFADKLDEIFKACKRASNLTQQLLTFSSGGTPVKNVVSVKDLIFDVVSFILSGSTIKIEYNIDPQLWNIDVDYGQISQVIQNIVLNSYQAMPDGGRIFVDAENYQSVAGETVLAPSRRK